MKKLLITGFDPFGGSDSNPSEQAVQLLPDVLGDFARGYQHTELY